MEKFKKYLKITLAVLIALFVVLAVISWISNYQYEKAREIDETIAFECKSEGRETSLKFALDSTPKSREKSVYYSGGHVISQRTSEVSDEQTLSWLDMRIKSRDIDYVNIHVPHNYGEYIFALDRKNFALEFRYENSSGVISDQRDYQCELTDYESLKQQVWDNTELESNVI